MAISLRSIKHAGAVAAVTVALSGQVLTQQVLAQAASGSWFPFRLPGLTTGSVTPTATVAPVTPSSGPPEWSGESGSSGHPLMTADAIRAAATNFHNCLEQLWPEAARRGVPRALFDAQTAALTPDLRIMDLLDAQPEFTKSIWDYLDLLVSEDRIQGGRAILATHRATFDAVEKAFGVDRYVVAAFWGVESNYGTQIGQRSVVRSTATLACIGRRQDYFREEFWSALEILAHGDVTARDLQGSWAGAFGPTLVMPTAGIRPLLRIQVEAATAMPRRGRDPFPIPDRLDRQQSQEGRLGERADLGLRGASCPSISTSCWRTWSRVMTMQEWQRARHHPPRRQGVSRASTTAPIC